MGGKWGICLLEYKSKDCYIIVRVGFYISFARSRFLFYFIDEGIKVLKGKWFV